MFQDETSKMGGVRWVSFGCLLSSYPHNFKRVKKVAFILSMVRSSTESRGFQIDNVRGIAVPEGRFRFIRIMSE